MSTPVTSTVTVQVRCFAAGTRIATPCGEIAVEDLCVGDPVLTVLGEAAEKIIWIGYRHVDCARHPKPKLVWPVRIAAGAFGRGMPHSDLWLSPDHAIYVNDVLIPVRYLINRTTVMQVPVDNVTYYHIELRHHDVLLAQGLPAESYLDTGDRCDFANGGAPVRWFPEFSVRMWEAYGCAPLIVTGSTLNAARRLLSARAVAMDQHEAIAHAEAVLSSKALTPRTGNQPISRLPVAEVECRSHASIVDLGRPA
jgi:hypothetical protein